MELKPRLFGALIGFILSVLFIAFDWKVVFLIIGFTLIGYAAGMYLESGREIREKIRELLSLFFR